MDKNVLIVPLLRCKGTTKFVDSQILSGKSVKSLKSFKGDDDMHPIEKVA
jgi:hypothetical protein